MDTNKRTWDQRMQMCYHIKEMLLMALLDRWSARDPVHVEVSLEQTNDVIGNNSDSKGHA